jgi:hypothetical protein
VRATPCASDAIGDYSDARYYLDRAVPGVNADSDSVLAANVDRIPGVGECLTATNLAELPGNSHLVPAGTVVHAFAMPTRSGGKVYFFNHSPVRSAVVQITATAAGGGKYTGHIVSGVSSAGATGTLAMPEGLSSGMSALILNEEEDGQTGHRLSTSCYAVGQVAGVSGGQAIVIIRGAMGATTSPTSISGSGVTPDSGTWSRASNGTPVNVTLQTRTVWDSSAGVLYAYQRTMSFDARGLLVSVSAETQAVVDTATGCV